jgi:dTDP-4-amino-4,6-dideoxygalactose transaminase
LKSKVPFADPYITEEDVSNVCEAVRNKRLSQGEYVERFEKEFASFIGVKHAVTVSSGTSALHLALVITDVGPGDEVIVPSFSFVATANCVLYQGAKPVFVDIDPLTYNIAPHKIEEKISKRTKAIIPVHYGGQPADMDLIMELANRYGLYVIEDAAEAHGALYKGRKAGSISHVACFSFYPNKNMTTGEGGCITTNIGELAEKTRMMRSHGQDGRYQHVMLGYNYRLTDIQAALGLSQLKRLNWVIEKKIEKAQYYNKRINESFDDGVKPPYVAPYATHTYMLYTVRLKNQEKRDYAIKKLEKNGVETRIAFPPIHLQPFYQKLFNYNRGLLSVTEEVADTVLSLPIYPHIESETQDYVLSLLKEDVKDE